MWQWEMVQELNNTAIKYRGAVMEKYRKMTGKSIQTLYRIAKQNGFKHSRKKRSDKGSGELTENQIGFVGALIHTSSREVKGPIMDVETALSIAEDNGIIEPGTVSVSWMQSLLREREINAKALKTPEPSIRMRSLHPNHVHVFDASVCIQYYLKGGKGLRIMREDKFYKNKWQNFAKVKKKLIRYILTDHFSHTLYVKYFYTGGESQENLYDFFLSAWSGDKNDKFPFRGVPFVMLMDKASANVSNAIKAFLERLGVEIPPSLPNNPRRQGSAESAQDIVESKFESRLRFQPAHTVEELNQWAFDWCVWFNGNRIHSRHKMTRTQCWLTIKKEQLRDLPETQVLHYLFANPAEERTVGNDYSISFAYKNNARQEYMLDHIPGLIPNRSKVQVILRPFKWPEIGVVFNEKEYLVKPVEKVAGGFRKDAAVIGKEFKVAKETATQTAKARMENLAYGEDPVKDAVPFEGITVFGNQAQKVKHRFIPRTGCELNVSESGYLDKEISIMEFFKKLRRELVTIPMELNRAIRDTYGNTISLSQAERLIDLAGAGRLTVDSLAGADTNTGFERRALTG